jgi:hypothetical protein
MITNETVTANFIKDTGGSLRRPSIKKHDGRVLESRENTSKGGTLNMTDTNIVLGDNGQDKQYRSILSFSTKTLPDNAVITKVYLYVYHQDVIGGGNPINIFQGFIVDIRKGFFGSVPRLQKSDFQANANKSYALKPVFKNGRYKFNLTKAKDFINKTSTNRGVTQIRLRFKLDDNDNNAANYLRLFSGDGPQALRPKLVIKYYVP